MDCSKTNVIAVSYPHLSGGTLIKFINLNYAIDNAKREFDILIEGCSGKVSLRWNNDYLLVSFQAGQVIVIDYYSRLIRFQRNLSSQIVSSCWVSGCFPGCYSFICILASGSITLARQASSDGSFVLTIKQLKNWSNDCRAFLVPTSGKVQLIISTFNNILVEELVFDFWRGAIEELGVQRFILNVRFPAGAFQDRLTGNTYIVESTDNSFSLFCLNDQTSYPLTKADSFFILDNYGVAISRNEGFVIFKGRDQHDLFPSSYPKQLSFPHEGASSFAFCVSPNKSQVYYMKRDGSVRSIYSDTPGKNLSNAISQGGNLVDFYGVVTTKVLIDSQVEKIPFSISLASYLSSYTCLIATLLPKMTNNFIILTRIYRMSVFVESAISLFPDVSSAAKAIETIDIEHPFDLRPDFETLPIMIDPVMEIARYFVDFFNSESLQRQVWNHALANITILNTFIAALALLITFNGMLIELLENFEKSNSVSLLNFIRPQQKVLAAILERINSQELLAQLFALRKNATLPLNGLIKDEYSYPEIPSDIMLNSGNPLDTTHGIINQRPVPNSDNLCYKCSKPKMPPSKVIENSKYSFYYRFWHFSCPCGATL